MSDLISRKALIERLGELGWLEPNEDDREIKLVGIIKQMPTAYDVDNVVKQLEEAKETHDDECGFDDFEFLDCDIAIDIVKGGGLN